MDSIRNFKYRLIKNFFNEEELRILQPYCFSRLKGSWDTDHQAPMSPSWYKDPLLNTFLELKLKRMEEETRLKLYKTYAFWRYYSYGATLKKHKDRPSCEISITACIHKTDNWPIHVDKSSIEMEEGDCVVYLGCDLPHWRNEFKGEGCAQVFMHYVDQNGPHSKHKEDRLKDEQ